MCSPGAGAAETPLEPAARSVAAEDGDEGLRPQDSPSSRRARRDAEPSRGTLILTLGIVSIVLPIIGWIPGIIAIVMGRNDRLKIKSGQMDKNGADVTQAGWICGIIGTCLHTITCLGCGLYITVGFVLLASLQSGALKTGVPNAKNPAVPKVVRIQPPGQPQGPGPQKN